MAQDSPPLPQDANPSRVARRVFLLGGGAALGVTALAGMRWFNVGATVQGGDLTAPEAQAAAAAGEIILVDIRRPDEWARTGVGQGAVAIDMRADDFIEVLLRRTGGRKDLPIALICARGVRSARMLARLTKAGFTQILDVPEGMSGSGAGPGWLIRGLPVVQAD
ncbi:MAG: rhodanese-like domain-containing protein [Sulfitobacter sp.]